MEYGLIGEKLSHSYSKSIHESLADYSYELVSLAKEDFADFIRKGDFKGCNITIPYKKDIIPFCKNISPDAQRIGSVNTIVKETGGTISGYNTDYFGFLYMSRRADISFKSKKVLILGSGGTSMTVRTAVKDEGAKEVVIVSRSGDENYTNIKKHSDADIIINTTPIGMYPNSYESLIDLESFPKCSGVLDVIYNPLYTKLILQAKELGLKASGGLPMLVAQAVKAAEIFTGTKISENKIEEVLLSTQKSVENIVLIGMPGSGKTTIGTKLASILERPFFDTDELIVKETGQSIPDIFKEKGEDYFRTMESLKVEEVSKLKGCVIATGGGSILKKDNALALKSNGRLYFLERKLEDLAIAGRPLSSGVEALKKLYKERFPLYQHYSNFSISNDSTIETVAQRIVEDFNETSNP